MSFKIQKKIIALVVFMSLLLCTVIYGYGLDHLKIQRNIQALQAKSQIEQCGYFEQTLHDDQFLVQHQLAYRFKQANGDFIEFNADALTQHYYPLLVQLKAGDPICFAYAEHVQDWNDRYYLSYLKRDPRPLQNP